MEIKIHVHDEDGVMVDAMLYRNEQTDAVPAVVTMLTKQLVKGELEHKGRRGVSFTVARGD